MLNPLTRHHSLDSSGHHRTIEVTADDWVKVIRGEYLEMPGLNLTLTQIQRLWGIDETTTTTVVDKLCQTRFLALTRSGAYVRADA